MAKKKNVGMEVYGHWIFLLGIVIALVAGIAAQADMTITWVLAILGLIIGLLNISLKEEVPFLVAAIALILAANLTEALNIIPYIGDYIGSILYYIVALVAPAAIVVALKEIYSFARTD